MRENVDALRPGAGEDVGHHLELGARHQRAVEVVDVARRPRGRGPGEEHRHALEARVLDELRQPQDRVARGVVVAVHEEEQRPLARRPRGEFAVDLGDEGGVRTVDDRIDHRELDPRVGRQALWPLEGADDMGRRHGDVDRGEPELGRACAREEDAGDLRGGAGRGDVDAMLADVGNRLGRNGRVVDAHQVGRPAAAGERRGEDREREEEKAQPRVGGRRLKG
jgi:hypothetical protein